MLAWAPGPSRRTRFKWPSTIWRLAISRIRTASNRSSCIKPHSDESTGDMTEGAIHLRVAIVPHDELAEAAEPREEALDEPSMRCEQLGVDVAERRACALASKLVTCVLRENCSSTQLRELLRCLQAERMNPMLSHVAIVAGLALFLGTGAAALLSPPEGCRLKVVNSGGAGAPNYGDTTCSGTCNGPGDKNPCAVAVTTSGGAFVKFYCRCNGDLIVNQACNGELDLIDGEWQILCPKILCTNECAKSELPNPGTAVWACTCPDADG